MLIQPRMFSFGGLSSRRRRAARGAGQATPVTRTAAQRRIGPPRRPPRRGPRKLTKAVGRNRGANRARSVRNIDFFRQNDACRMSQCSRAFSNKQTREEARCGRSSGSRPCALRCSQTPRRAQLSQQVRAHHRAVPGRRSDRRHGAPHRAEAVGEARAAVRGREYRRRRRQYRHGECGESRRRRLHDPVRVIELCGQSEPLSKDPLRRREGLRADHQGGRRAECADRQPVGSGAHRQRADQPHQG